MVGLFWKQVCTTKPVTSRHRNYLPQIMILNRSYTIKYLFPNSPQLTRREGITPFFFYIVWVSISIESRYEASGSDSAVLSYWAQHLSLCFNFPFRKWPSTSWCTDPPEWEDLRELKLQMSVESSLYLAINSSYPNAITCYPRKAWNRSLNVHSSMTLILQVQLSNLIIFLSLLGWSSFNQYLGLFFSWPILCINKLSG